MASGRMEFHADSIMQHANFCFVLPNDVEMEEVKDLRHYDRPPMNLILLHGLTGTDTDWLYGGCAQEMAIQYNLNVFMPTTGNSFYLDKGWRGGNYSQFIAEELPEYIEKTFGIKMTRETTIIGGLSMGGYGTLHTALAYPDRFCAAIALSSALIVKGMTENGGESPDSVVPASMMKDIFGDPADVLNSDKNVEWQYRQLKMHGALSPSDGAVSGSGDTSGAAAEGDSELGADQAPVRIPRIYFAVGTEDALVTANREFRDFLRKQGARGLTISNGKTSEELDCSKKLDYIYEEGPGKHNWTFWNEYLNRGLGRLLCE